MIDKLKGAALLGWGLLMMALFTVGVGGAARLGYELFMLGWRVLP